MKWMGWEGVVKEWEGKKATVGDEAVAELQTAVKAAEEAAEGMEGDAKTAQDAEVANRSCFRAVEVRFESELTICRW
jgi:hypothetical protein